MKLTWFWDLRDKIDTINSWGTLILKVKSTKLTQLNIEVQNCNCDMYKDQNCGLAEIKSISVNHMIV